MRVVIQRVSHASVCINGNCKSSIGPGMLILIGIEDTDESEDIEWLCKKIVNLRIFDDENGVMNKSILDVNGDILVISQFTLHASTKKGNRPLHQSCQTRNFHPTLRTILPEIEFFTRKRNWNRRIRSRHESGVIKRWSGHYMHRY